MHRERSVIPLDMYNTPDAVTDFYIRVTRLKIEDLEGDIIDRQKQIDEMEIMLSCDPSNATLNSGIAAINKIIKNKIRVKKSFKSALVKIQKHGSKLFEIATSDSDNAVD